MTTKNQAEKIEDMFDYESTPLSSCAFGGKELLCLEVIRYFCLSYAEPNSENWLVAFQRCENALGRTNGFMLAYGVSDLLNIVRRERKQTFYFVNPSCKKCSVHIFSTERAIIGLIEAAQRDDRETMRSLCSEIIGTGNHTDFIESGLALGAMLNNVQFTDELSLETMHIQVPWLQ